MLGLFLLSFAVDAMKCYPYQCAPSDFKMPKGYCSNSYNQTFFLQPCASTQTCNIYTGLCKNPSPEPATISYPGEPCMTSDDCTSGKCAGNYCLGALLNELCADDEDCNPGMHCLASTCRKQLDVLEQGCINDYDCVNTAMCNSTGGNLAGTCLNYLSVSTGLVVDDCVGGVSHLCKTTECSKMATFGTLGICKASSVSVGALPVACTSYTNCTGYDGSIYTTSFCSCGYNNKGTAYCGLFSGDLPTQTYYSTWQKALVASNNQCNTARRYSDACLKKIGYYSQIMIATWNYYMYAEMQNNDNCVKEIITSQGYIDDTAVYLVLPLFLALFS